MDQFVNWLSLHWAELLAYLGLGAGGAAGAQKLRDKNQDVKLKKHSDTLTEIDKRLNEMDKLIVKVQNDLALNQQADVMRTNRIEEILSDLRAGQKEMHTMIMELFRQKQK